MGLTRTITFNLTATLTGNIVVEEETSGQNLVVNGDFSDGFTGWSSYTDPEGEPQEWELGSGTFAQVDLTGSTAPPLDSSYLLGSLTSNLPSGKTYRLTADATFPSGTSQLSFRTLTVDDFTDNGADFDTSTGTSSSLEHVFETGSEIKNILFVVYRDGSEEGLYTVSNVSITEV